MSVTLDKVLGWNALGLCVIPLKPGAKVAACEWKTYQTERPTPEMLTRWFGNGANHNAGIPLGKVSGVVVVESDSEAHEKLCAEHLPPTPMMTRSHRGVHRYYRYPSKSIEIPTRYTIGKEKIEIKRDGNYVVAPGSTHPSGHVYSEIGQWPSSLSELPELPLNGLKPRKTATTPASEPTGDHGVSRDSRIRMARTWIARQAVAMEGLGGDDHTYKIACAISVDFDLPEQDALAVMRGWNARCQPPWPEDELLSKIRGAAEYAKGTRGAKLHFKSRTTTHRDGSVTTEVAAGNLDNVRLALAKLGVHLSFDAFAQKILINGHLLDDGAANQVWVAIDDTFKFRPSKDVLRTVLETEAKLSTVHPVRDYLAALRWDGTPRIDTWLIAYGQAGDSELVRAIGAIVLIAAVRRVRQPGCKFDELLIWESEQGEQKSTALRTLCPNNAWFSDDLQLGASSKEIIETTAGKWLVEASEMVGNQREADRLKGFLSRQTDGPVRLAYAHYGTEVPRQFIVIGTTNKQAYLKDSTGNRRFWPVRVQRFDVDALRRDRDQLWAEAAIREANGESIRLNEGLWKAAADEQKRREIMDPWEETLLPTFEKDASYRIAPSDLWMCLGVAGSFRNEQAAARLAAIMQRRGFKRMTVRDEKNAVVWGWGRSTGYAIQPWPPKHPPVDPDQPPLDDEGKGE